MATKAEKMKYLGMTRTESALQRGTHALSKEHINDNVDSLPKGVRDSIKTKAAIAAAINRGQSDNSVSSMRERYSIDGKVLDRKRAVELRDSRKALFEKHRKHKKGF